MKLIKSVFVLVILSLCVACEYTTVIKDPPSDDATSYQIRLENTSAFDLSNATAKITLYGRNKNVADNSATAITTTETKISQLPVTLSLEWPANADQLIDSPPVSKPEDAAYYFHVAIDADSDNQLCPSDYLQDYDQTPFFELSAPPNHLLTISVKLIGAGSCRPF